MAFRREMHDRIRAVLRQDPVQRSAVADVGLLEDIARGVPDRCDIRQVRGIGQRVEVHHLMSPRDRQPHHRRADEARPAGHQDLHAEPVRIMAACLAFIENIALVHLRQRML